jgi:hypothetical protein
MGKILESARDKPETEVNCSHHWIIESPNGPTSWGICKFCGARKEFNNYLPLSSWEEGKPTQVKLPGKKNSKSGKNGATKLPKTYLYKKEEL